MKENITILKNAYIYGYPMVGMYELLYSQVLWPETKTTHFQHSVVWHKGALVTN